MKFFSILALFLFCKTCSQQAPPSTCRENIPFRLNDQSCDSFNTICLKTGDPQCDQLLNACKQCPPNNITLSILRDIWNMSKFQSNFIMEIMEDKIRNIIVQQFLTNKTNASPLANNSASSSSLILIFLGIIILILFIQFVETRFKLITKCILNKKRERSCDYKLMQSRKKNLMDVLSGKVESLSTQLVEINNKTSKELSEINNNTANELSDINEKIESLSQQLANHIQYMKNQPLEINNKTTKELSDIKQKVESLSKQLATPIQNLQNSLSATPHATIRFPLEGIDHKYFELYVHTNHNVLQLKQRLCASLLNAKCDDYKRMKLKYDGKMLDDNDYLLKQIEPFNNNSVNYIIDEKINVSEIVVVKLKGKMSLPEIMQIQKNESIENISLQIAKFINYENFIIYKEFIENMQMIELINNANKNYEKKKIQNDLKDGDFLHVVTIEKGELILRSIFNEIDLFHVKYQNTDQISTFTQRRTNGLNEYIFFYRNKKMNERDYLFQFDISNDSQVKFCQFKRFGGIKKTQAMHMGKNEDWEIYFATHKENENILMKKYKIKSENWKSEDWVLNELRTFLITKSHPRFILLNGVYVDKNAFYVSMENMIGGTLEYYLNKNKKIDSEQIIKWAAQILEGLNFLHQYEIIYRDLNPLSILVGDNNDLKLSNFNLSKYKVYQSSSIIDKKKQLYRLKVRYMSPEILESKQLDYQCDVWSFGAVLVRIVTGKKPFPKLNKEDAQKKILDSGTIEYDFPSDKYDVKIKSFINSCFGKDPNSRPKLETLIENELIQSLHK